MVMEDLPTPRPAYVLKRGRYDMPDTSQKVDPGVPACLGALPPGSPANRLALARWLASPENPLTARVAVNRLWQQHFGTGLVKTTENFGLQSEPPSHPALLDWLATELIRTGWDLKAMHRLIVTSATYRQASKASASLIQRDPENRLLARVPGSACPPSSCATTPWPSRDCSPRGSAGPRSSPTSRPVSGKSWPAGQGRRPTFRTRARTSSAAASTSIASGPFPIPAWPTSTRPSREICQVKRSRTNTPLQALELLNDVTYVEAANHLARRMLAEGGQSPRDRLILGFRRATARTPNEAELRVLLAGLDRYRQTFQANPSLASQWIALGDSPKATGADPLELAAYAATASVIMNLDETITRE